jgi:epoxyqueuosine reductase
MSHLSALTCEIRDVARQLGFFRTGIVRAGPLPDSSRLDQWLKQGMCGEMSYLERQSAKRRDPRLVLEGVRTIITVAINYHASGELTAEPLRGRISRYAWGDDYHLLVQPRLERLLDFLRDRVPGTRGIAFVDTGPVMEKSWAALSSLGWLGKNANVLTREQGSWFFVGVILVDLDLECEAQRPGHCGTCTRCIHACPTGAIVAPYVVDARLCISYLTIELRGAIPRKLRPLIGNRIFGCDDCQEVCPWNRFAVTTTEPAFLPAAGNLMPELAPLVRLTQEEFSRRFSSSPVRRVKRDGFVRNVVVALGNSGNREAVAPLVHAMSDTSPLVRTHAAWALGQLRTPEVGTTLRVARARESDPEVLAEIDRALAPEPESRT